MSTVGTVNAMSGMHRLVIALGLAFAELHNFCLIP